MKPVMTNLCRAWNKNLLFLKVLIRSILISGSTQMKKKIQMSWLQTYFKNREQESSGDEKHVHHQKVTHSKCLSTIQKTFVHIEKEKAATPVIITTITKWHNNAAKKSLLPGKQKSIKGFFKWTISYFYKRFKSVY